MKQFLMIACFLIGLSGALQAQPYGDYSSTGGTPYKTTLDTVQNTGADTFDAPIPGVKNSVMFQHNMKKVDGTTSGVTVKLFISADKGLTYSGPVMNVTCPDGDTSFHYIFTGNPGTHYRTIITGSATQRSSHQSFLNIR